MGRRGKGNKDERFLSLLFCESTVQKNKQNKTTTTAKKKKNRKKVLIVLKLCKIKGIHLKS